jgi:hypothetical protein
MSFELPENFTPDFEKAFMIAGNRFSIQVQAYGVIDRRWTWIYSIVVKGHSVSPGLFYWSVNNDKELTNESVTNRLASFWGDSDVVRNAQKLEPTTDVKLEELIFKCAEWMHEYFGQSTEEFRDFEVIQRFMDDNGWEIVLSPNYLHGRIVEFSWLIVDDNIKVVSYIEDNELSIKF